MTNLEASLHAILGHDIAATFALAILRANLAAGAVILLVLALRAPVRRLWGPETSYVLWLAPLLAAGAVFLPGRVSDAVAPAGATGLPLPAVPMLTAWVMGALIAGALVLVAQRRFDAELRAGRVGPALVGVLTPRIVMPADDGRYTLQEREFMRVHERTHMLRRDPAWRALVAAMQCLFWFNPLVHLAAAVIRLDQELACDAAVLRPRQQDKAAYARTLLKAQLAAQRSPLACFWAAGGRHPLELRLTALKTTRRTDSLAAPVFLGAAIALTTLGAWASKPPSPRFEPRGAPLWQANLDDGRPSMNVLLVREKSF